MEDIESPCQFVFKWLWRNMGIEGVETTENQTGVENLSFLWSSFPDQKPLSKSLSPIGGPSLVAALKLADTIEAGYKIIKNGNLE